MDRPTPTLASAPGRVVWTAGRIGRDWFPWDGQVGPLTEADLLLLRTLDDLLPADGTFLATFPDHEVLGAYAARAELGLEPLPTAWVAGDAGLERRGEPCMLVQPKRFGDLVELFAFANRDGAGIGFNVFLVADQARLPDLVAVLRRLPGTPADPTPHVHAWGLVETPGPTRTARLVLETAPGREAGLAAGLAGALEARLEAARALGPSPAPADRRRYLHRLLG